jgi:hypothetical protein
VSNVVRFPLATAQRHSGLEIIVEPPHGSHAVQFYEDEAFLFDTAARFVNAGLKAGEPALVVTTKAHRRGIVQRLDRELLEQAQRSGRLSFVDARHLLSTLMIGGLPDPVRFRGSMERVLGQLSAGSPPQLRVRIFGEMVDLLWKDGNVEGALALERLWNEAGSRHSFSLLCAYAMSNFGRECDTAPFTDVCDGHSHVLPTERFLRLDDAAAQLRELSALEQRAELLEGEVARRGQVERALREALRERTRTEMELRASLEREQRARARGDERGLQVARHALRPRSARAAAHDLDDGAPDDHAARALVREPASARARARERSAHAAHDRAAPGFDRGSALGGYRGVP